MKNIKSLINLIKTSTKAQIVTGAVAVAVVGTVVLEVMQYITTIKKEILAHQILG